MNAHKMAATAAAFGLTLGLIGAGVSAQWTDSATAQAGVSVGTFACTITSPNVGAVVSNNGHTVSWTMPLITNSGQGPYQDFSIDLHNSGSIPQHVTWTIVGPNYTNSHLGVTSGSPDMNVAFDLAAGATKHYDNLGFQIADPTQPGDPNHGHPLDNNDLNRTFTATYTANCGEVPVVGPPTSQVSFVGANDAASATVNLPAGSQAGDMALALSIDGTGTAGPSGWLTPTYAANNNTGYRSATAYHVLTAADIASGHVTFPKTTGNMVAVYRGVAGIGNEYASNSGNNQNWSCNTSYDQKLIATGSSWVVCMGGDGKVPSSMKNLYAPSVWGTTLRSGGFPMTSLGLSDSGHAVSSWTPPIYASGTYNYAASYAYELLSK